MDNVKLFPSVEVDVADLAIGTVTELELLDAEAAMVFVRHKLDHGTPENKWLNLEAQSSLLYPYNTYKHTHTHTDKTHSHTHTHTHTHI